MTVRIGALRWNQYTGWPALLEAGRRADRLGYDSLWTRDHLDPIGVPPWGPRGRSGSRVAPSYRAADSDRRILGLGRRPVLPDRRASTCGAPGGIRMTGWLAFLALLLAAGPVHADVTLPPGFTTEVYVTGQGFDTSGERGVSGIPSVGTLGVDAAGTLYMARTGARFRVGDIEDLSAIYRIPVGGARLTPDGESRYLYGPPLPNPQIGAVAARGPVWVTTYDRERRLGALYRFVDGKPTLFAGGRPEAGGAPALRHPESVVITPAGDIYVTDREEGAIVRLDARGKVVDPRHARVQRPRMLTLDEAGNLWVGGDGTAETPFGAGSGEILRITPDGRTESILPGPLPAGFSQSPGGALFVAQRRTGQLFVVTPDGRRLDFATARSGSFVRTLAFVPVTPETRRAGIAGDLLVVLVSRSLWLLNEVVRISGPFDEWVRQEASRPAP